MKTFTRLATGVFLLSTTLAPAASIQVHGHRGSRGTRPENTLPAFREAVAAGVDFLELDLHLSADGVLIISHDPELTPQLCRDPQGSVLKAPVAIRTLTAAQIQTYDCGSVFNPAFPRQVLQPNTPKPTFEALLTWVEENAPRVQLNVETKMDQGSNDPDPAAFVASIAAALQRHHLLERSVLQSFDGRTITAAHASIPTWRTSALFTSSSDYCADTAKLGATYASPEFHLVTADNVAECHRRGIGVLPWTVDDEASWRAQIADEVDGLITDFPRDLIEYLAKQN